MNNLTFIYFVQYFTTRHSVIRKVFIKQSKGQSHTLIKGEGRYIVPGIYCILHYYGNECMP